MIESTELEPIKFFESFLTESSIRSFKEEFYDFYDQGEFSNSYVRIDKDSELVIVQYQETDNDGIVHNIENKEFFRTKFERKLKVEFGKSKQLIDKIIAQSKINRNDVADFLKWQQQLLTNIKTCSTQLINLYPFVRYPIDGLIRHIQGRLNIQAIDIGMSYAAQEEPTKDLVSEIFEFLRGRNNAGLKIMSDAEYDRLIIAIREMKENESLPEVTPPFSKLNISNDLLKFCFYVLHKKLYGIKPQKPYFVPFLKKSFSQFNNMREETLKTKFSTPPETMDKFVPPIVQEAARTRKKS